MISIDWTKIHDRNAFSPLMPFLAFLSFLYGFAVRLRVGAYNEKRRQSLPGFVVSVGNLTVGGTGKTPAVLALAQWAKDEGYRVAVLSRGYGGRYGAKVLEVTDGKDLKAGPAEAGDEPCLLAKRLRGVPVVLARKRYLAGQYACNRFGCNFLILDDGFQHLALNRDIDLVLLDGRRPFGNAHLLPWGPLREPVENLRRADAFIVTGSDRAGDRIESGLPDFLRHKYPEKPIFPARHVPERICFPEKRESHDPGYVRGKRVLAFAGIAMPERFMGTLKRLGAEVAGFIRFGDHHFFTARDIEKLFSEKDRVKAECLITTEKDWVRMEGLTAGDPALAYLTIRFDLPDREGFFKMVKEKAQTRISS